MFYDQEANKTWVKYGWPTMTWQTGWGNKGGDGVGGKWGRLISRGRMDQKWETWRHFRVVGCLCLRKDCRWSQIRLIICDKSLLLLPTFWLTFLDPHMASGPCYLLGPWIPHCASTVTANYTHKSPPDILYEICPCQWLVGTKLSHSNRELCIGRTPLVGRRGNPHWNGFIKQSKGRVNCERSFLSGLILWSPRYCVVSWAQQEAGLRSHHQLHLPHPILSFLGRVNDILVSRPPPAQLNMHLMKGTVLSVHPKL